MLLRVPPRLLRLAVAVAVVAVVRFPAAVGHSRRCRHEGRHHECDDEPNTLAHCFLLGLHVPSGRAWPGCPIPARTPRRTGSWLLEYPYIGRIWPKSATDNGSGR